MDTSDLSAVVERLRHIRTDVSDVEVKRASTDKLPKSLKESVSALANTHGGLIILGLEEQGQFTATGVENPGKLSADLATVCSTEVVPAVRPEIEIVRFEGVDLIVCEIEALSVQERPCYVKSQGMERGSYIRVHDGDQHLSTYEIHVMVSNRGQPRDDEEPVTGATIANLDPAMTVAFLARLRERRPQAFAGLSDQDALARAKITRNIGGLTVPTVTGLLALGDYPQEFFPQLNVTFVHYPSVDGTEDNTGTRFIDNVSIDGPIPTMLVEAIRALRRNMSRRAVIQGVGRTDVTEYPETALREAIVNACVHRDLSGPAQGMQVQIEMFPDRLTIKNPGGLYGPVTLDGLGEEGISSARNATLLRTLEDVQVPGEARTVCENRGSGIRSMIVALRRANMSLPSFSDRIGAFEVTFPNHSLLSDEAVAWIHGLNQVGLTESQCVGLALLREGHSLNNEGYRAANSLDSRVATTELGDLVTRGLTVQAGGRRWATYRLAPGIQREVSAIANTETRSSPADRRAEFLAILGDKTLSRQELEILSGHGSQVVRHWMRTLRQENKVELVGGSGPQSRSTRYRRTTIADELQRGQQLLEFEED